MGLEQIIIIKLSNLLLKFEKDIIEGRNKMSLTVPLLHKVNYYALQVMECDHVYFENSKSTLKESLIFIHGLIKKTLKLIITQKVMRETWNVDLRMFSSLKYLELSMIPLKLVIGIESLRCHIEILVCERCKGCLQDLLGSSDVWDQLRTAKLSRCGFVSLPLLINTPLLQYLDLSHNNLGKRLSLQPLKNLKYLNVSYNSFKCPPELSKEVCRSLVVFLINNNHIQDAAAIGLLENLEILDMSHNVLADHASILSVLFLPYLRSIDFRNNPISYHPLHRFYICSFLNKRVSQEIFLLDGKQLSAAEKKIITRRGEVNIPASDHRVCLLTNHTAVEPVSEKDVLVVGTTNPKPAISVNIPESSQKNNPEIEKHRHFKMLTDMLRRDYWLNSRTASDVQDNVDTQDFTFIGHQTSSFFSEQPASCPSLTRIPSVTNQIDSVYIGKEGDSSVNCNFDSDIEVISSPSQSSIEDL